MNEKNFTFIVPTVLPDGNGSFTPCPELLTEQEAIRYLRIDVDNTPSPKRALKYYRDLGQLVAIQVGRKNKYRRQDLDSFLAFKSEGKREKISKW